LNSILDVEAIVYSVGGLIMVILNKPLAHRLRQRRSAVRLRRSWSLWQVRLLWVVVGAGLIVSGLFIS
jgi:hypothetical protein